MKKIYYFLVFFVYVAVFTSCSDTSDNQKAVLTDTINGYVYQNIDRIISSINIPELPADTLDFAKFDFFWGS